MKSEKLTGKGAFWIKDLKYKCSLYPNGKLVRLKKDEKNSEHFEIIGVKISGDLVKLPQHHNQIELILIIQNILGSNSEFETI